MPPARFARSDRRTLTMYADPRHATPAYFAAFGIPLIGKIIGDAASPVRVDLKPGSNLQATLNGSAEPFPRVGIQHYAKKLFVEWRLVGDYVDNPEGPNGGRYWARQANGAFMTNTACAVLGWLMSSQIYPNAMQNYQIPKGDSHVGETKSDLTRRELRKALLHNLSVPKRDTW